MALTAYPTMPTRTYPCHCRNQPTRTPRQTNRSQHVKKIDTEQQHKFSVENFKNNVASQFLNVCLLGLLILAILDFFKGNGDALSNGVEALKTLAMVAVGFLFGSSAKSGS